MARCTAEGELHPADALLRDLHRVVANAEEVHREAADLVQADLRRDQVGMVLDHPARSERATGLLVGDDEQCHVATRSHAAAGEREHHREIHRGLTLHVDRAAAPETAVGDLAAEGVVPPALRLGFDHIGVRREEQRPAGAATGDAADEVRAARRDLEDARFEPGRAQYTRHVFDRLCLVARRIHRAHADQSLEVTEGLVGPGVGRLRQQRTRLRRGRRRGREVRHASPLNRPARRRRDSTTHPRRPVGPGSTARIGERSPEQRGKAAVQDRAPGELFHVYGHSDRGPGTVHREWDREAAVVADQARTTRQEGDQFMRRSGGYV